MQIMKTEGEFPSRITAINHRRVEDNEMGGEQRFSGWNFLLLMRGTEMDA